MASNLRQRQHRLPRCIFSVSVTIALIACSGCVVAVKPDLEEVEYANKRIESKVRVDQGLADSHEFWLSSRDNLAINFGWDEFTLRGHKPDTDTTCTSFLSEPCFECKSCANTCAPNNNSVYPISELGTVKRDGVVVATVGSGTGCIRQDRKPAVQAEDGSTFEFTTERFVKIKDDVPTTLTLKTRIVSGPRSFLLPMKRYVDPDYPDQLRFQAAVPSEQGKLTVNFSGGLAATKARMLLGTGDSETGDFMVRDDAETVRRLRPSLIYWTQLFTQGTHAPISKRCYSDPQSADGGLVFARCFADPAASSRQRWDLNPVYEPTAVRDQLTWFVEYSVLGGAPNVPEFRPGEFPVIEFTIE